MSRERGLSPSDAEALLAVARDASAGASFRERMERLGGVLARALGAHCQTRWALDLARPAEAQAAFEGRDEADLREYLEVFREHDPMNGSIVAADSKVVALSDFIPDAAFGRDVFTGDFLPRANVRFIVGFTAPMPDGLRMGMAFQREPSRRGDFGLRERRLLQLAVPDLTRAAFGALLREKVERLAAAATPGPGAVVFDARGDVAHGDPAGLALLRAAGDEALERLSRLARELAARAREGEVAERTLTPLDGRQVVARAATFRLAAAWGVLVTLRPVQRAAPAQAALARSRLSEREQEVARLACEGLINREIAARLEISPATVSVHMTRVFRKLGVSGRTGLVRWVHENAR